MNVTWCAQLSPELPLHSLITVCVCADELLEDIAAGRCSVGENVRKVAGQWLEVAACIPPSFFQVRVSHVSHVSRVVPQID